MNIVTAVSCCVGISSKRHTVSCW